MEDFILKEIDKIGELVAGIASKMGIYKENIPDYTIADVQSEFAANKTGIDLDAIVKQQYPISYLVEQEKVTLKALETITDIIYHSDIDGKKKKEILNDALTYLDSNGYISFRLHSFV